MSKSYISSLHMTLCLLLPESYTARELAAVLHTATEEAPTPTAGSVAWMDTALLDLHARGAAEFAGSRTDPASGLTQDAYRGVKPEDLASKRRAVSTWGLAAIPCANCHEPFERRQESQIYCSRSECRAEMHRGQMRGWKLRGGRRKTEALAPLLALAVALLLPLSLPAKGHGVGGRTTPRVKPPSAAVESQTNPTGWPLPAEILRDGLTLSSSAVEGATTDVMTLSLPLTGPGGRRYVAEMRRIHDDGGECWRVRFLPLTERGRR